MNNKEKVKKLKKIINHWFLSNNQKVFEVYKFINDIPEPEDPDKDLTPAQIVHKYNSAYMTIESRIDDLFEKYEKDFPEYHVDFDWYDNSIEIYFDEVRPYPYEPCKEIKDGIYDLGFSIVYWNFIDENGKYTEEIRGREPRRFKDGGHNFIDGVGYVDNRYNNE